MSDRNCRGVPCATPLTCAMAKKCLYKSSADLLYEERKRTLQLEQGMETPKPVVADFAGAVDGLGVKAVMKNPKSGVQMIDPQFILGVGDVLTYGATKYAKNNWMRGMAWSEVFGAILRHLCLWFMGEERDKESGLPHLHHAACSIMFLGYYARDKKHHQFDDRVFRGGDNDGK